MPIMMGTWAHANAVVAERPGGGALQDVEGRPWTAIVGHRMGGVAVYEGTGTIDSAVRGTTWFHIPVPSVSWLPTSQPGVAGRAFLDSFCLLFRAERCAVTAVHAWDGGHDRFFMSSRAVPPVPIAGEAMTGDWTAYNKEGATVSGVRMSNLFAPRDPASGRRHEMLFGLGISFLVDFTGGAGSRIVVFGAGASWADDPLN